MAFKDTETTGDAMKKAVKLGATHFYKMYAGKMDKELFSLWFFKGNTPLIFDPISASNPKINTVTDCFHEVATYNLIMKSFKPLERLTGLVTQDDLIEIDCFYFDHLNQISC